jgi:Txe/YoeB family toxin of Txe-Axe toxin-antitoxin module
MLGLSSVCYADQLVNLSRMLYSENLRYWIEIGQRIALRVLDLVKAILHDPFRVLANRNR